MGNEEWQKTELRKNFTRVLRLECTLTCSGIRSDISVRIIDILYSTWTAKRLSRYQA